MHVLVYVLFACSFVSRYFLISFVISFLIIWLFGTVLYNFYIFANFPDFHTPLFSNISIVIREQASDDFNPFKFIEVVCWPNIRRGEHTVCLQKNVRSAV